MVLSQLPWSDRPAARAVLAAFETAGLPVRFVGGCVRDAHLGIAHDKTDLDLATPALPEVITQLLEAAGIKAVPTGIAFGTITAVGAGGDKLEITTLREDIETDGRHATVKYGTSWQSDAARRDFTINALYADPDGTVHDYYSGLGDLAARRVRFIGDAATRITEDYLRVLRFFRFTARFADAPDETGLAACAIARTGLSRLARERVWMELSKILCLETPGAALRAMHDTAILEELLPGDNNIGRLQRYADYEHDHRLPPFAALRLAALASAPALELDNALRLSNREQNWLKVARDSMAAADYRGLAVQWYHHESVIGHGRDELYSLAMLLLADDDEAGRNRWQAEQLSQFAASWDPPVFPLTGADILALDVSPGPRVGEILDLIESWWLENEFRPGRADCLVKARELARI